MEISNESVYELQRSFKAHLSSEYYSLAEANLISNDALLLFHQSLDISFEEFLKKGITKDLCNSLQKYFMLSGNQKAAQVKVSRYLNAMQLFYDFFRTQHPEGVVSHCNTQESGILISYCSAMRLQYSYKPLLILAMLEIATTNGSCSLSELAHYFINYYSDRSRRGLVIEKADSLFAKKEIVFSEAKQNILNNAARVLAKDGIITIDGEQITFTSSAAFDYRNNKEKVACLCQELLNSYFSKLLLAAPDSKFEKESMLGRTLSQMYNGASSREKVTMIHLFGVKYGPLIEKDKLNVSNIIKYSGLPNSYYVEVRKGIRLAQYVTAKE